MEALRCPNCRACGTGTGLSVVCADDKGRRCSVCSQRLTAREANRTGVCECCAAVKMAG